MIADFFAENGVLKNACRNHILAVELTILLAEFSILEQKSMKSTYISQNAFTVNILFKKLPRSL